MGRGRLTNWLVATLLLVHALLLAHGAVRHSFAWTEAGLLPAGIRHWRTASFEDFRVNPPLVRMIGSLPALLLDPQLPASPPDEDPRVRSEWTLARVMVEHNGERTLWMLVLARWICIPISLLGAWICYRWAGDLFGSRAGLVALCLWCFSPEMLGHGHLITGDAAAAVFGLFTLYVLRQWLRCPKWYSAFALGTGMGLAVLSKTSWLIIFALVPMLWLAWRAIDRGRPGGVRWAGETAMIATSVLFALFLVNMCYGFSGSFRPLGDYHFLSRMLRGTETVPGQREPLDEQNRFRGTAWGWLPVPLPQDFVIGVDLQKWDLERPRTSYLDGQWRGHGWWEYYIYALMLKWPLGNWLLLLVAVAGLLSGASRRVPLGELVLLVVPAVAVLVSASSQTGLSKHSRYVLPMLPFLFVIASQAATINLPGVARRLLVGLPLVWSLTSSLWIYPHSMSYFNESVGGPMNGYRHLNSSNIHWGQDLLFLQRWYEAQPAVRPLYLTYTISPVRPEHLGFVAPGEPQASAPPAGAAAEETEGDDVWLAVDMAQLTAFSRNLDAIERLPIEGMAGYGFRIFRMPADDGVQIRRELGLTFRRLGSSQEEGGPRL